MENKFGDKQCHGQKVMLIIRLHKTDVHEKLPIWKDRSFPYWNA